MENSMPKVTIRADVVREHLARRNLSQNHLAMKAGVSQGYLSQLLHKQRNPGPAVRERLMAALKVREFDALFEIVREEAQ
jgi:transcriptional regulator with XRE-family HTH domain